MIWLTLYFLLFNKLYANETKEKELDPLFEGWYKQDFQKCAQPLTKLEDYGCLSYFWNYELVNMELLHDDPPIIIYRDLIRKTDINAFIANIRDEQRKIKSNLKALHRATELTFEHRAVLGAARTFEKISRYIPFIDFTISDPWQVLVFDEGAHLAPRHEYINVLSEDDKLRYKFGNRFATFTIALQKAMEGGEYLFSSMSRKYIMEAGDAMLWTSMDEFGGKEYKTMHGDCPVRGGEKITATLRLRAKGQFFPMFAAAFGYYDFAMLVRPNVKYLGMTPIDDWWK
ncbi:unnamed protein product [Cylicocyclus nassatus]|uniref:Prolyl 4-hydroxylase alpha subunit domain-containing protein n=1 Tax=Cylicocyclus nassatus TaxID=53992 RepID=A0AA36DNT2_CYLNA|nr:unnamed protein product [Cylicocyclus nassatus]